MRVSALVRVAMIVDLVGSRRHADRAWVHRSLVAALDATNRLVSFDQPMAPTLGDESQGRFMALDDALRASLLLRLLLPEGMDCRAGIGIGTVENLGVGAYGPIQDGPAWWAARDAIVEAKAREVGRTPTLRTWYEITDRPEFPVGDYPSPALVNAFLLTRDEVVSQMSQRSRRLLLGLMQGRSQSEMASAEGITQSAVSQSLRRSGAAAVVSSHDELTTWGGPRAGADQ
jgi:hypothetical protein